MDDNIASELDTFIQMSRESPIQTGLFIFSLPMFALLQLLNGVIHGGSLLFIGSFAVLAIACSVLLAQYQLAVYRQQQLSGQRL